jgi:hypothetical protein
MGQNKQRIGSLVAWVGDHLGWDLLVKWVIPIILSIGVGTVAWMKVTPLWQVLALMVAFYILGCLIIRWLWKSAKKTAEKSGFRPHPFPKNTAAIIDGTTLSMGVEKGNVQAPFGRSDGCRVRIHNNSETLPVENVKVSVVRIDPIPNHSHPLSYDKSTPLPDLFPIQLRTEPQTGDVINPGSEAYYGLFALVRHSNIPTVQFIAKDKEYGLYSTQQAEHVVTLEISAKSCTAFKEQIKVQFSHDLRGIPTFKVEKLA